MRNLRSAFYLLYAGLALLIAACSTLTAAERAQREREVAMQVEKALAERQYTISISMMFPRRGNAVSVTPDYSVQMKGDSLFSYLPYFGAAYNVPYGGGKGLNWDAPLTGYQVSAGRKGATIVEMTAYNGEDYFLYSLELMPNGTAYLNVRSRDREPISFSGDMDLRTD